MGQMPSGEKLMFGRDDGSAPPRSMNAESHVDEKTPTIQERELHHLDGWRLHLTTLGIVLTLLLINLEVTIVSTSLVAITNDLHGLTKTSWIVTGYLVTYMGFMMLWSRLSDMFGRKYTFIATMLLFTAFSGACGGSKTMNQLIIFRTIQGIGGAGGYALSTLVTYEMVPKSKLPLYGAINSVWVALATLIGPLFGGLINNDTTWRWVFYLNLPAGAFVLGVLWLAMPPGFPYSSMDHHSGVSKTSQWAKLRGFGGFKEVDVVGATLLLSGALLLSAALLETSLRHGWSAGGTVSLLVLSAISWLFFFAWEWHISKKGNSLKPFFPWKWIRNRPWMAMLILTFLAGVPFNVLVVYLPQRLQIASGKSALNAGIHLLPYTFGAAVGAILGNVFAKRKLPVAYILLIASVLQVLGLALLSTLPTTRNFPDKGYGFAVIAGVGMGMTFGILILATPFMVPTDDFAIASGSILQFRFLGGVVGLGIAANVLNGRISNDLSGLLNPRTFAQVMENVDVVQKLPDEVRDKVVHVFTKGYNLQTFIMIGFAGAQFLAILLGWNKNWTRSDWIAGNPEGDSEK